MFGWLRRKTKEQTEIWMSPAHKGKSTLRTVVAEETPYAVRYKVEYLEINIHTGEERWRHAYTSDWRLKTAERMPPPPPPNITLPPIL